jgi:microcin C transport system ATP-binding protein
LPWRWPASPLLIADEPTTALDVTVQAQILQLLDELQQELGMAVLFITHDLNLVRRFADKVVVMRGGLVVESGKVAQVFSHPAHPYTAELLASRPDVLEDDAGDGPAPAAGAVSRSAIAVRAAGSAGGCCRWCSRCRWKCRRADAGHCR